MEDLSFEYDHNGLPAKPHRHNNHNHHLIWKTFLLSVSPGSVSMSDSSPLDPPEKYQDYHHLMMRMMVMMMMILMMMTESDDEDDDERDG